MICYPTADCAAHCIPTSSYLHHQSGHWMQVFRHNDLHHLEQLLRAAMWEGQPRGPRPWKKILIVVEGIYSMEGEVCQLAQIVALKKKYKVPTVIIDIQSPRHGKSELADRQSSTESCLLS